MIKYVKILKDIRDYKTGEVYEIKRDISSPEAGGLIHAGLAEFTDKPIEVTKETKPKKKGK